MIDTEHFQFSPDFKILKKLILKGFQQKYKMFHKSVEKFAFQFVSDLHLEFRRRLPTIVPKAPNLLLAGDIGLPSKSNYLRFFQTIQKDFEHIFYVPGNHEYYHFNRTMEETDKLMKEMLSPFPNIHLLNNSSYDLPDTKIIGTTLWTNVPDSTPKINDNFQISINKDKRLTLKETRNLHKKAVDFLTQEIKNSDRPIVVLTHHMPSFQMVQERYVASPYNPHFYSNLDHLFIPPVKAWVCGHSHGFVEKKINEIPCLLNAVGYPLEHTEFKGIIE